MTNMKVHLQLENNDYYAYGSLYSGVLPQFMLWNSVNSRYKQYNKFEIEMMRDGQALTAMTILYFYY